ncbi:ABC transporter permease [Nonomuraea typhae]|uniref:ABC transporter permease n=1 Tax=Nonomuraea typhae TaxID=2603600 RepID=UPI0012FBEFA1|nr:ABC transporter permease [Nonomuraea typhae]
MRAILASEWLKLRSVNSTGYAIGAAGLAVVLGIVWTLYVGSLADQRGSIRAAAPEEGFLPLVQISLAVLGVLAITSEHAGGLLRTSLAAVPSRGRLLLAKATLVGAVTLAVSGAVLLATYAASRVIAGDRSLGFNTGSLADGLLPVLASTLSVTVLALVGLGLGAATRSTTTGIVSVVAILFVLPGIVTYLPAPWNTRVASIMVPNLIPQITGERLSRRLGEGVLQPWVALLVLVGYGAAALLAGYQAMKRRDA